mgnify:CR=1 FL=1
MDGFFTPNRLVAFERMASPMANLGYGHSSPVTQGDVTHKNCWFMTNGLIKPGDMPAEPDTFLGAAMQYSSRVNHAPIEASTMMNRASFLEEMRALKSEMNVMAAGQTCYVESNLRAFTHIPDFNRDWPPVPPLGNLIPPSDRRRQIDIGTIGLLSPIGGSDNFKRIGEMYSFADGENRKEVWVLSPEFQNHMPPGETHAQQGVVLGRSVSFPNDPPRSASDFVSAIFPAMGPNASVFLVHAAVSSEIPAS